MINWRSHRPRVLIQPSYRNHFGLREFLWEHFYQLYCDSLLEYLKNKDTIFVRLNVMVNRDYLKPNEDNSG